MYIYYVIGFVLNWNIEVQDWKDECKIKGP